MIYIHIFNKYKWLTSKGADRIRAHVHGVLLGQELLIVTIEQMWLMQLFLFFRWADFLLMKSNSIAVKTASAQLALHGLPVRDVVPHVLLWLRVFMRLGSRNCLWLHSVLDVPRDRFGLARWGSTHRIFKGLFLVHLAQFSEVHTLILARTFCVEHRSSRLLLS